MLGQSLVGLEGWDATKEIQPDLKFQGVRLVTDRGVLLAQACRDLGLQ